MQCYRVGGSVRDELLGLPGADRDWVVVGATAQQMIDLGFQPVGKDFPVFLHPQTHEEYALARTERKTGPGYKGFEVRFSSAVTLEEDLARRDLTITAIARADDGELIDPFGGRQDLRDRILRHVSDAFAEDPVRILRVARFAARFAEFTVAPETLALMRAMTAAGEADALVAERVWQELARGLMERRPSRMIAVLAASGALAVLLPELATAPLAAALDRAAAADEPLPVRYSILLAGVTADAAASVSARLRVPNDCRETAILVTTELGSATGAPVAAGRWLGELAAASPPALLAQLIRCDAWRRPARAERLIHAAARLADADPLTHPGGIRLRTALAAAAAVDQGALARRHPGKPQAIREAIDAARLAAVRAATA